MGDAVPGGIGRRDFAVAVGDAWWLGLATAALWPAFELYVLGIVRREPWAAGTQFRTVPEGPILYEPSLTVLTGALLGWLAILLGVRAARPSRVEPRGWPRRLAAPAVALASLAASALLAPR